MEQRPFSLAALILVIVGFVIFFVLIAILIFNPSALQNLLSRDGSPTASVAAPTTVSAPTEVATLAPIATETATLTTQPSQATATTPAQVITPTPSETATLAATATVAFTNTTAPILTNTAAPTITPTLSPTPVPLGPDRAAFVEDITVPDGTAFAEGEEFVKTWRIRNVGTSTWTTDYVFEFAGGAPMALVTQLALPNSVAPGETIDFSIPMKVPVGLGKKTSLFQLRNASGGTFGVGQQYNEFIYVEIFVVETSSPSATP